MTVTVAKPSAFIRSICLEPVGKLQLFKFNDELQRRMELLLDKKKADQLDSDEQLELESIGELDRIFTHMNALLLAEA